MVIMFIEGYMCGRGLKFYVYRFNNCKRKIKVKKKFVNERCIYMVFFLYCILEGGLVVFGFLVN